MKKKFFILVSTLFLFYGALIGWILTNYPAYILSSRDKHGDEVAAAVDSSEVSVTYIGNAGFMVTTGDKKILIDAIFKGYKGYYESPDSIQEKIRFGQPPFDGVDLLLVTHNHGDHYDAGLVRKYLTNYSITEHRSN